ncbi:DNA repair protein XRCC1-like [Periplaneta americana]|uniref:DNA repair protein XRCC1-like n=1 Tax=Periplaneta americana TaxID=6978 RepID=UPI0037E82D91
MPAIKIERIISCSSEDTNHPALNLISTNSKSWKCKTPGEKQVAVVLQLEKETVINSIDIGNENSAFVEIFVGRSSTPDVDFQILLVASSFMSPMEARNGTNSNRVRMFTTDKLSKPAADQKWDRVKIVCTQPFNKHVQYGLAFVTFHSLADDKPAASIHKLGRFVVKDNEDEPDTISAGSLFARRKELDVPPLKGAAAIREASSPSAIAKQKVEESTSATLRGKLSPAVKAKPTQGSSGNSPAVGEKHKQGQVSTEKKPSREISPSDDVPWYTQPKKVKYIPLKEESSRKNGTQNNRGKNPDKTDRHNSKTKMKTEPVPKKPKRVGKPFEELLNGVVLVISGYQNPLRGNLRTMALEMGAKYKPDWDNTCTHLICAFTGTPKFQQVWGKGHIVRKDWIEDCHSKRTRLPWRRYALDKRDQKKPESEDEIPELLQDVPDSPPPQQQDSGEGSDMGSQPDSGSDTEDEIQRVKNCTGQTKGVSLYDEDTDVDSDVELPDTANMPLPHLPDLFVGKGFYLDEELDTDLRSKLQRYILAFKGSLLEDIDDSQVDIVIANKKVKSRCPVVKPQWVWRCNDAEALLPTAQYECH